MKKKEIKQTNFRTWKSGKTWIYSSTVIAALAGGAATVSKVKADSVTDPQVTALAQDAQQQAQTQQVEAQMAGSTTPATTTPATTTPATTTTEDTTVAASTQPAAAPATATDTATSTVAASTQPAAAPAVTTDDAATATTAATPAASAVASTSTAAVSQTLATQTSASAVATSASLSPESAAMEVASYAAQAAPSIASAVASAKAAGDTSMANTLGQIGTLLTNISSAAAVSPSAAATYLSSVTSALSSAAENPALLAVSSQLATQASSAVSDATTLANNSNLASAASTVASWQSNAEALSSVAASGGDVAVESMLTSAMSSMAQTSAGKAELQSLATSFASALATSSNASLNNTIATTAASDAASLAASAAAAGNSDASDAAAVANVMALWQANAANPNADTAAALSAAKSALTASQNALASSLMAQVGQELKAKGITVSAGSMSLASATATTTGTTVTTSIGDSATDAMNSNISFFQALAIPVVPIILGVTTAVITGDTAAFLAQALLGVAAVAGSAITMAAPNMFPVVDWFMTATEAIGIGTAEGLMGGLVVGIGTAIITGAPFGYAAGAEVDDATIAPMLGIDVSDSTQGQANRNMISNILLLAAASGVVFGATGATAGGVLSAMIVHTLSGLGGLLAGALATIPFVGAVTIPLENAFVAIVDEFDIIGGDLVGIPAAVLGAEFGGVLGYLLTTSGVMSSAFNLLGGILSSVLSSSSTTVIGGGGSTAATGAIAVQSSVTVAKGGSFTPLSLVQSAKDSAGNTVPVTNLTVTGSVPTKVPGVYVVVYSFQDPETGATVSQTATVTVGSTQANMSLDQSAISAEATEAANAAVTSTQDLAFA